MTLTSIDVHKQILLNAGRARVWRALTDAAEFGAWFQVNLKDSFAPGQRNAGHLTYPGYEHLILELWVERMEPEVLFSFRWHPYAVDPQVDYAQEPTTLVAFRLETVPGGTQVTVVESGFGELPPARREEAWRMNDRGWAEQMGNLQRHVAG